MFKKILTLVFLFGLGLVGALYYSLMVAPVVPKGEPVSVAIPTGASYEQVLDTLAAQGITPNRRLFDPLAERMGWKRDRMRSGRFSLAPGLSAVGLIRKLRAGSREAVKVILTVEREPANVAAKAARFLEADSLAFVRGLCGRGTASAATGPVGRRLRHRRRRYPPTCCLSARGGYC